MLHIYSSQNQHCLAEKLHEVIHNNWKSPLTSPIVLFSDTKIESWLKLNWINKSAGENSILLNLKTGRLEQFLFTALAAKTNSTVFYQMLTQEIFSDYIAQKLISDVGDKKYFQTLEDSDNEVKSVLKYLSLGEEGVNELHLYDFSRDIAKLFLNYERILGTEFVQSWAGLGSKNQPDLYFNFKDKDTKNLEQWQQKLYKDVFDLTSKKYVTVSQIAALNKKENGSLQFELEKNSGIYIFGFGEIENNQRDLLLELAQANPQQEIHLFFIGNTFAKQSAEECENSLVKKWSIAGFENLRAMENWDCKNVTIEKVESKADSSSLLHSVQNSIVHDLAKPDGGFKRDDSIVFTCAPSMEKEIEFVHSQISKIILEKKSKKEIVNFSDFLVLSPNIADYRVPIILVFGQDTQAVKQVANKNVFPKIPYIMADFCADQSFTAAALENLHSILLSKSLSRVDFFNLVRNPVVQLVKGFSQEEVSAWTVFVDSMKVYRDRNSIEDWKTAAKRILLSRLTDNVAVIDDERYLPYMDINSQDDELLLHFVDAIDDLESWREKYSDKPQISLDDLNDIELFLERWLKVSKKVPQELSGENIVYSNIRQCLTFKKTLINEDFSALNATNVFLSLVACAKGTRGSNNMLFFGGITFSNLEFNRTIPAKYVFIVGLDSKVFPEEDKTTVLDLLSYRKRSNGEISPSLKCKNTFINQLMATEERLFISYVNKDLKKDEDFFRSSVVNDLLSFIKDENQKFEEFENELGIDEKRKWEELFTQHEFRNKHNFIKLKQQKKNQDDSGLQKGEHDIKKLPDRVSISQLKSFLSNPFSFYVDSVLDSNEDNEAIIEHTQFEPIEFNNLEQTDLIRELIQKRFGGETENLEENLKKDLKDKHILPDGVFGDKAFSDLNESSIVLTQILKEIAKNNPIEFEENANELFTQDFELQDSTETKNWLLTGRLRWHFWGTGVDKEGNPIKTLDTIDLITKNSIKNNHYLSSYLTALYLLAAKKDDEYYSVKMNIVTMTGGIDSKFLEVHTKDEAQTILKEIYKAAYWEKFNRYYPINVKAKDYVKKQLSDYINAQVYGEHTDWSYIKKSSLFNPYKDIGFTEKEFQSEWVETVKFMAKLVAYLTVDLEEEQEQE